MTDAVKSTHSDSEAAGTVTPAGGEDKKRPLDKENSAPLDTSAAAPVEVTPAGRIRKEDLDILFTGLDLSEDFQDKAFTLFEGAISLKVAEISAKLQEDFDTKAKTLAEEYEEKIGVVKEDLEDKLDSYLNLVVETWLKDNELAVENGIKAEISESLLTGMINLLSEHNIAVPTEKVDVLEALTMKVDELEKDLNESLLTNAENKKLIESFERAKIFDKLSEGMDLVSKDKLATMTEAVSFTDGASFERAVTTLKESISVSTTAKPDMLNESVDIEAPKGQDDRMAKYLETMKRMG